eukprot:tig00000113_g5651.t1
MGCCSAKPAEGPVQAREYVLPAPVGAQMPPAPAAPSSAAHAPAAAAVVHGQHRAAAPPGPAAAPAPIGATAGSRIVHGVRLEPPTLATPSQVDVRLGDQALPRPAAAAARPAAANLNLDNRTIRVFLSSTFRDMQEERDHIFKSAVPRLRRLCSSRGLFFVPLDLRWGISDEAVQGGRVALLCLREVDRSKYFVAFLKGRYGWHAAPGAGRDELLERTLDLAQAEYPFVGPLRQRSVTELEIVAGALRDAPAQRENALFYYASQAMVAADAARSEPEGPYARERLAALKGEIRRAGLRVCGEEYGSPARLAELVHDDLASLIERDFPESAGRDWLEEERAAHGAFAAARQRIYVPQRAALEALDRYAGSDSEGIAAVSGPPGAGKSALLANWAAGWRAAHAADVVVEHYCGGSQAGARVPGLLDASSSPSDTLPSLRTPSTPHSSPHFPHPPSLPPPPPIPHPPSAPSTHLRHPPCPSPAGGWRRRSAGPSTPWTPSFAPEPGQEGSEAALASRFAGWLTGACAALDRRLVLRLAWLPPALCGPRLRIVVSAAPGEALESARAMPHTEVAVPELTPAMRSAVLQADLAVAGKTLAPGLEARVCGAPQTASPLFLGVLLEELKGSAVHAVLEQRVGELLSCGNARELYAAVLRRWCGLYGEGLVAGTACRLLAARDGLAESEMAALAGVQGSGPGPEGGTGGEAVSQLAWSEFLGAALDYSALLNRGGLYAFAHASAAEAAAGAFGYGDGRPWRRQLAAYFLAQARPPPASGRRTFEAGHQLAALGDKEALAQLAALLSELPALRHLSAGPFRDELQRWWAATGEAAGARGRYAAALARFSGTDAETAQAYCDVGRALKTLGRYREAGEFLERGARLAEKVAAAGERRAELIPVADAFADLGELWAQQAEYERAKQAYRAALAYREAASGPGRRAFTAIAGVHYRAGDYAEALRLYQELEAASERALGPTSPALAAVLNNKGLALQALGQYPRALEAYERALGISERALPAMHPHLAPVLNNVALACQKMGRTERARACFERALAINERARGPNHPEVATSLANLGALHAAMAQLDRADELLARALGIREEALGPEHPDTATCLFHMAGVARARGDLRGALASYQRVLEVRERALGPRHLETAMAMNALGSVHRQLGDLGEAERLYEASCAALEAALGPAHPDFGAALSNLAGLYAAKGDFQRAVPLVERDLAISEGLLGPGSPELATLLSNLAALYAKAGDAGRARELSLRALGIKEGALGPGHPALVDDLHRLADLACGPRPPTPHPPPPPGPPRSKAGALDEAGDYYAAPIPPRPGAGKRSGRGPPFLSHALAPRSLAIHEGRAGPRDPATLQVLKSLAAMRMRAKRHAEALPLYERAAGADEAALGAQHPTTAGTLTNVGACLLETGRVQEAAGAFQRALEAAEASGGSRHAAAQNAADWLAVAAEKMGDAGHAAEIRRQYGIE